LASEEINLTEVISDWFDRRGRDIKDHFEEYDIDRATIAHRVSLSITLIIAFVVRLYPLLLGWDPLIKAFDPWMQLRTAKYILSHGFWEFLVWHDPFSWYPYGRFIGTSMYIGVPLAVGLIYSVLTFFGFSVTPEVAGFFVPIVFGTITVYMMYLLGKELISRRAGLFSAMIMAVTPSFLSRSIGGFVDNESVGVLFIVMTFYFFSRAFLRDSNRSAVMAGLSLFALASSWGAFRFAYDLMPVIALVLIITGKFTERHLRAYVTTITIAAMLMIMVPRVGGQILTDLEGLAPVGMIAFLVLFGILQNLSRHLSSDSFRKVIVIGFISLAVLLGGMFIILLTTGFVANVGSKFISVLIPTFRNNLPLIDSVSEHLPLAWSSLYSNLSTMVFFIPIGIYYALKQPSEKNVFILTFSLVTIYFSGSMVRLILILAPAAALLTALAIDNLLLGFAYAAHGRIKLTKITMEMPSIGGQNAFGSYIIVFFLMIIMLSSGINAAGDRFAAPEITPSLSGSSGPQNSMTDWLDAFSWMKANTNYHDYAKDNFEGLKNGQPPVMLSWWDYGYYITNGGDTVTLVDNATSNSTQIGVVGTMLMYNATTAINLMYMYNVHYVLVVPAGGQLGLGSDIGKSIWMIRISQKYTPEYGVKESNYFDSNSGYKAKYFDSVLWKLMAYKAPDMGQGPSGTPPFAQSSQQSDPLGNLVPDYRTTGAVTQLTYFTEVFRSTGVLQSSPGVYPHIRIYKVNYPADIDQRVNAFQETMAHIRSAE